MRGARMMLAMILVLAWTSAAAAECAWVLWHQLSAVETGYGAWEVENAFATHAVCAAMREEEFQLKIMALQATEGATNVKKDAINKSYMYDTEGQRRIGRYACLPDTIDPREKKE